MINIDTLQAEGFKGEFYKIYIQRQAFLLFPPPDFSNLRLFSTTQQRKLGKINVHFNITSIVKNSHFFKDFNFILLTEHTEMFYLPFLTKLLPQVSIISTNLAYQLARISLQYFQETLSDFDATSEQLDFFEEGERKDKYEENLDISLQNWRSIYTRQDIKSCLSKVIKVNYHQYFNTERGIILRCFPSGKNNGSCFWQLKNIQTHQKVLLVNQIAQFNWSTCQTYNSSRLRQSTEEEPYSFVIFTKKTFEEYSKLEQTKISQIIKNINANANRGASTTVVLDDKCLSINLIPRLTIQPQGSIQSIVLGNQSFHHFHNYVNSYVDYLSPYYKNQIFSDPPDYPLIHYSKLASKGRILTGSFQEQAVKRKLPLKQIILQSHPFVRFIPSYEYFLELEENSLVGSYVQHQAQFVNLGSNFGQNMLQQFISIFSKAKVVCFNEEMPNIQCLSLGTRYNLSGDYKYPIYMKARNIKNQKFYTYFVKDNELQLLPIEESFVQISKKWPDTLKKELHKKGIQVIHHDKNAINTQNTKIYLSEEMELCIESKSSSQLLKIGSCLQSLRKKLQLQ